MDTPGNLVDSPMRGVDKNSKPKSERLEGSVGDLGQSDLCKNIEKTGSLPCPFKCVTNFFYLSNYFSHVLKPKWIFTFILCLYTDTSF